VNVHNNIDLFSVVAGSQNEYKSAPIYQLKLKTLTAYWFFVLETTKKLYIIKSLRKFDQICEN